MNDFVNVCIVKKRNRQNKWHKATIPFDLEFKFSTFSNIYTRQFEYFVGISTGTNIDGCIY
jgi:hypothetical protein